MNFLPLLIYRSLYPLEASRQADWPSDYRPIVLLYEAGKLLERVIADRIVRYLERTGPGLSECQFVFRAIWFTLDAVQRLEVCPGVCH